MIRRPPRSTLSSSSAASDVYKRQEKCQARKKESQRAHIMFSLRAFLRLEVQRIKNGISWFESKMKIHRVAAIVYLNLSLIHISEPTRLLSISYAVFCLKKK